MDLIKRDRTEPFESLTHLRQEMSDLLDYLSSTPQMEGFVSPEFPPIIVSTSGDNVIVRAELPGVKTSDLDVQVLDDVLTIKGERISIIDTARVTYLRKERNYGTFARFIMLPEKVDVEKVTASYKNGVLTIILPKPAELKPKQVVIKKSQ